MWLASFTSTKTSFPRHLWLNVTRTSVRIFVPWQLSVRTTSTSLPLKYQTRYFLVMSLLSDILGQTIFFRPSRSVLTYPIVRISPAKVSIIKFPGNFENIRATSWLTISPWILALVRGATIIEGPTDKNYIIDCLVKYHPATGEWSCIHEDVYLAKDIFLDNIGACPLPPDMLQV